MCYELNWQVITQLYFQTDLLYFFLLEFHIIVCGLDSIIARRWINGMLVKTLVLLSVSQLPAAAAAGMQQIRIAYYMFLNWEFIISFWVQ